MSYQVRQGDIINIGDISTPVLVVSKDFFNSCKEIIGCPIVINAIPGPLHLPINTDLVQGYVLCEQLKLFDLNTRRWKKVCDIRINDIINITDAIQSIFDYI